MGWQKSAEGIVGLLDQAEGLNMIYRQELWRAALDVGVAPPVILEATHEATLRYVSIEDLKAHALVPL